MYDFAKKRKKRLLKKNMGKYWGIIRIFWIIRIIFRFFQLSYNLRFESGRGSEKCKVIHILWCRMYNMHNASEI